MDKPVVSNRGFLHFPAIEGTYGDEVRAYESSAASQHCIWISSKSPNVDLPAGEAGVHLPVEEARRLAEHILYLCDQG